MTDAGATSPRVLFVCTGNYYRSRFAEAVFNHHAAARGSEWSAFSRGLAIHLADGDLSEHTHTALVARKIPLTRTGRTRVSLSEEDLRGAQHIIALKEIEHRPLFQVAFPAWLDRVTFWHAHDIDVAHPDEGLPEIERHVLALLDELDAQRQRTQNRK